jgi:hypothetical protein
MELRESLTSLPTCGSDHAFVWRRTLMRHRMTATKQKSNSFGRLPSA